VAQNTPRRGSQPDAVEEEEKKDINRGFFGNLKSAVDKAGDVVSEPKQDYYRPRHAFAREQVGIGAPSVSCW
jgi:hypothetical protein